MKSLAGNDVSIFLFQFVLRNTGITFILNEAIAEDLYLDIEELMQPLVQACSETLMRYRHLCHTDIIMDGNILTEGCFEVMLSKGLGKYFAEKEKQNLFSDAHEIANLLTEVIDRRTKESEQGISHVPQPVIPKIGQSQSTNKSLEALGRKRESLESMAFSDSKLRGLKQLKPDDLPLGVLAKRGYDHRGHCYAFEHVTLGDIGKVILINAGGNTKMEVELHTGNSGMLSEKKRILEEITDILEQGLRNAVKIT